MSLDIPGFLDRLCYRFPSPLVDGVIEREPGVRLAAVKNLTVNEEFFQGHFPGTPLMPGVLIIESLVQAASMLLLDTEDESPTSRVVLRGVNNARFRHPVVPGDRLRLDVQISRRRRRVAVVAAVARVDDQVVAEAELLLGLVVGAASIDPSAHVAAGAEIGAGTVIGPNAVIGPHVRIGQGCQIGASAVIEGWTTIGDDNQIFPFASIGLVPQDTKFRGERTELIIGSRNTLREFVTLHRGTEGGGRGHPHRRRQPPDGVRPCGARLPGRTQDHFRQRGDSQRSCIRRGPGQYRGVLCRSSVFVGSDAKPSLAGSR